MKTFRLVGMALIAVMMCLNFVACSGDDEEEDSKEIATHFRANFKLSTSYDALHCADVKVTITDGNGYVLNTINLTEESGACYTVNTKRTTPPSIYTFTFIITKKQDYTPAAEHLYRLHGTISGEITFMKADGTILYDGPLSFGATLISENVKGNELKDSYSSSRTFTVTNEDPYIYDDL